jgi:hypothetical protein
VAHACNPSYSGGRDQEDRGLKPAWANTLRDLILKKTHHKKKRAEVEWLKVQALSSNPSTAKKKFFYIIIIHTLNFSELYFR